MMRLIMRLFRRRQPPERAILPLIDSRNPAHDVAQRDYQEEKNAFIQHEAERLSRLKRLGYDFDITTGKDHRGSY